MRAGADDPPALAPVVPQKATVVLADRQDSAANPAMTKFVTDAGFTDALDCVLLAIDGLRQADGSPTPLRGAGAPQNRVSRPEPDHDDRTETSE